MVREKGMWDINEMVDLPRKQGTPGMKNKMLLTLRKKNNILYWPSPLPPHGQFGELAN